MGRPEFIHTHTFILTGKPYKMSALFLRDFSILEEIEWGHFIPPTASDLDCIPAFWREACKLRVLAQLVK